MNVSKQLSDRMHSSSWCILTCPMADRRTNVDCIISNGPPSYSFYKYNPPNIYETIFFSFFHFIWMDYKEKKKTTFINHWEFRLIDYIAQIFIWDLLSQFLLLSIVVFLFSSMSLCIGSNLGQWKTYTMSILSCGIW